MIKWMKKFASRFARKPEVSSEQKLAEALRNSNLFKNFSKTELLSLANLFQEISLPSNTIFIHEGDEPTDLFVLIEGEAEILKKEKDSKKNHTIATLKSGSVVGELSLIDNYPRSATVRTTQHSTLLRIPIATLRDILEKKPKLTNRVYFNLAQELNTRLKAINEETVEALQQRLIAAQMRVAIGRFMADILIIIFVFVFFMQGIAYLARSAQNTTYISGPSIIVFGLAALVVMLRSGFPMATFGFTLKNAGRNAMMATLYTIPVLMLILLGKWLAMLYLPSFAHDTLFDNPFMSAHSTMDAKFFTVITLCYLIIVPFQEIISRGAFQGSLQIFLTGKNKNLLAILLATLGFSVMHLPMEAIFPVIVFPLSLFWGWIYLKQGDLIGVSVSHMLVGVWGISIVGFQPLLHTH